MFLAHRPGSPARTITSEADAQEVRDVPWLDLLDPTEEEQALAARVTGQRIPTRAELDEIESSSRLFMEDDAVYLSTPLVRQIGDDFFASPVGFVLMRDRLLTIRFTGFTAFDVVARQVAGRRRGHQSLRRGRLERGLPRGPTQLCVPGSSCSSRPPPRGRSAPLATPRIF